MFCRWQKIEFHILKYENLENLKMEGIWKIEYDSGTKSEITFKQTGDMYKLKGSFWEHGVFYQKQGNYKGKWCLLNRHLVLKFAIKSGPGKNLNAIVSKCCTTFSGAKHDEQYKNGVLTFKARKVDYLDVSKVDYCEGDVSDIDSEELSDIGTESSDNSDDNSKEDEPPIELQILENEVQFLLSKCKKSKVWKEFAINKIKNIYKNNPTLSKKVLLNSTGLTHFSEFFSESELKDHVLTTFKSGIQWYVENSDKITNKEYRCIISKHIVDSAYDIEYPKEFKITKEELDETNLYNQQIVFLLNHDIYDFEDGFEHDFIKYVLRKQRDHIILNVLKQIKSLPLEKVGKYIDIYTKRYRNHYYTNGDSDEDSSNSYSDAYTTIVDRLLELYKIHSLIEEMKPSGICARLLIEKYSEVKGIQCPSGPIGPEGVEGSDDSDGTVSGTESTDDSELEN